MHKRKPKILNYIIRETKKSWMTLHIKVYCKEGRNLPAVHLFLWCEICLILDSVAVLLLQIM